MRQTNLNNYFPLQVPHSPGLFKRPLKKTLKIAILLPNLNCGGVEVVRLALAHEFENTGHVVQFVLMSAQGDLLAEAGKRFPVVNLRVSRFRSIILPLSNYLKTCKPDVLLAAMWPLTVLAPMAQLLSGVSCKVVISEHAVLSMQYSNLSLGQRLIMRAAMAIGYRFASARLGVSNGVISDIARFSGLRRSSFHLAYNPLAHNSVLNSCDLRRVEVLWGDESRGARILSVGTLKKQKNHALLLRAFSMIKTPNARLVIVGQGEEMMALQRLAVELGIIYRVLFAGYQSDPATFYATADLFVLSSDYEGFGNVLIEALAQGLPIVSTDCPSGPSEILGGGRWGRIVPVGDAKALAEAITLSLASPHDKQELIDRSSTFTPKRAAQAYLSTFM
jgi:glycosyltransferase involved in cell wall biosynthesis